MKHGPIDWLALLMTLISLIFILSGATWCVSPKSFVKVHRTLFPKTPDSTTASWESRVCSISGRVVGAIVRLLRNLHALSGVDGRVSLGRASIPTGRKSTLLRIGSKRTRHSQNGSCGGTLGSPVPRREREWNERPTATGCENAGVYRLLRANASGISD